MISLFAKNKKIIFSLFTIVLLVIIFIIFINISKNNKYNRGLEYFNSEKYEAAVELFTEMGNYKDSKSIKTEAEYKQARKLMENNDFQNAITIFEKLGQYKDSTDMIWEAKYQLAILNIESENYDKAYEQLSEIGNYKDTKAYLKHYRYELKEKQYTDFNNNKTITTYQYDDEGKLIQEIKDGKVITCEYNGACLFKKFDDEATYYYNVWGDIVKEIRKNEIYETIYDDTGRKKETYSYNANGAITHKVIYQYFDDNSEEYDAIETGIFYDFDGEISEAWVAKLWYDRYGNEEIQEREVSSYGEVTARTKIENKYVYDSNGNWLEHYEYANGILQIKRTQEFDKNGNIVKQASYNKDGYLISQTIYLYENIYSNVIYNR